MNVHLPPRLTVDEFLRWSMEQERGRYELEGGRIVAMAPQNADHAKTKARVYNALAAAIARSGVSCYAMPDGMTVRIPAERAYEPDALVASLPEIPGDSLEIPNPIIVVEVLSPTPKSVKRDLITKLRAYALVSSIEHYVIVDPDERTVLAFRRRGDLLVPAEELTEGTLRLDPPGLDVAISDMLIPKPDR